MGYLSPHISISDTTTQAISVADTPQVVTFDTTNVAKKIVKTTSSRFTVNEAGVYLIMVSAEIATTAANKTLDIWLRVNGSDVANTNSKINLVNLNDQKRVTTTNAVTITAGQYVELWISGDSTSLTLSSYAAGVSPTRPATPSIIMIIDRLP